MRTDTLRIEKIAAQVGISHEALSLSTARDDILDMTLLTLVRKVAVIPGESALRVPDGWWQAFKESHFDALLRWFPVRYRTYEAMGALPNFPIPDKYGPVVAVWSAT